MNPQLKKKIIKYVAMPIVGAVLLMVFMLKVVTPLAQKQLYIFGANAYIKPEQRCQKYVNQYVAEMIGKQNPAVILENAKQDKCTK